MRHPRSAGFTMIELMIVVVLVAILLALAAPSFQGMLARNKLEGVAGEFVTDLQYARSEAVSRNANVGLVATTACYTIYQESNPAAGSCTCSNTPACTGGPTLIKTVSFAGSGVVGNTAATFLFEPVRGSLSDGVDRAVTLTSAVGGASLTADVKAVGRVKACSPSGTLRGYPAC